MKRNWKGFFAGMMFTAVLMSFIGTAYATVGKRTAEINYSNISVTLDGEKVNLVDANGNSVEPFAIDGTTYLPVRAVANALGLEVMWDASTNTVKLSTIPHYEKPQKDGFSVGTNQTLKMRNYTFSIPNYWEEDEHSDTSYQAYAETGGKVAVLSIYCAVDNVDPVSFDALCADNENMILMIEEMFEGTGECNVSGFKEFHSGNGVDGIIYDFTLGMNLDGMTIPGTGSVACFPSVEDNYWFFVMMGNIGDTEYEYDEDFMKVLLSIQKGIVSSQADTVNQSTKSSTTITNSKTQPSTSSGSNTSSGNSNRTVYITKTGSKYHYDSSCNGGTYYRSSLSEAKSMGLGPCNKCVK